jgi:multiple sugar transport system ATP-binding protein
MASVTLKGITKKFDGDVTAVSCFNLDIADKEFVILVGPSGCGKTTMLRIIAGLETATEGDVIIDGKCVNNVLPKDRDIAVVFQNYALYPHMSVFDNMAFSLKLKHMKKKGIVERVNDVSRVLNVELLLNRRPRALSGGQKQRVALGRAIIRHPKMFLMDEPLSNLDAQLRGQMRTEICKLHQRLQTTFIYVTHDQTEAMTMGTRIVVMKGGLIQQVDEPQTLYDHPVNMFVAGFIGNHPMNFAETKVTAESGDICLRLGCNALKMPDEKARILQEKGYVGKDVIFGIRPEDVTKAENSLEPGNHAIVEAVVEVVERLGSENILHVRIDSTDFTAIVKPSASSGPGSTIRLALDMDKLHVFDKDLQTSIFRSIPDVYQ